MSGQLGHFDQQFSKRSNVEKFNNNDYVSHSLDNDETKTKNFYESLAHHMNLNSINNNKDDSRPSHFDYKIPTSFNEYNTLLNRLKILNKFKPKLVKKIKTDFENYINKKHQRVVKRSHTGEDLAYAIKKQK